jgi:integrase
LTGCRKTEILHAKWEHIDWERAQLVLPDSKTGSRRVPLSAAALAVLETLPRLGVYIVASDTAGMEDEQPRHDLNRPWRTISKRAGLEGLRIHDLRHSFASVGAGLGLGLPIVGKLLGHKEPATTARYAHFDIDPLRRATDRIGAVIEGALTRKPPAPVVPFNKQRS